MTAKVTRCPVCQTEVKQKDLIKEWDATPHRRQGEISVTIHYWRCPRCGEKFRTATRTWPEEKKPLGRFGKFGPRRPTGSRPS